MCYLQLKRKFILNTEVNKLSLSLSRHWDTIMKTWHQLTVLWRSVKISYYFIHHLSPISVCKSTPRILKQWACVNFYLRGKKVLFPDMYWIIFLIIMSLFLKSMNFTHAHSLFFLDMNLAPKIITNYNFIPNIFPFILKIMKVYSKYSLTSFVILPL